MISKEARALIDSLPDKRENFLCDDEYSLEVERKEWEESITFTFDKRLEYKTVMVDDVEVEVCGKGTKNNSCILYFHGGGFISGSIKTHRQFCSNLALQTGLEVWNVNYTLAPEKKFPCQIDETVKVARYLIEHNYNLIIGGDSAGGALALSTALELVHNYKNVPKAVFMLSPWLDLSLSGNTIDSLDSVDVFIIKEDLQRCARFYCTPGEIDAASPLFASFTPAFPVYLDVGTDEILLDDSRRFEKKWKDIGGQIRYIERERMWHAYQLWDSNIPESDKALGELADYIVSVGAGS